MVKNRYSKGKEKKNRIVEASKNLFYDYGYEKTTVTMIKNEADVSLSAIPYYFKEKDNIVQHIYNEFLSKVYDFVEKKAGSEADSYLKHFYVSRIYYDIIVNDENNRRFYHEVSVKKSNYSLLYPYLDQVYFNYAKDFSISLTDEKYRLTRMADAGARREVFTHYFSEENRYSIDEVVDYVTQIVATLMGIDKSVSEEYAKKSLEFKNEMPYGHIRFLK